MRDSPVCRVLMTGDTVGGVWSFTLELCRALIPHNVEVFLAAMGGEPGKELRAEADAIPNLRLLTSDYKLEWMDNPWQDVKASGEWLLDLESRLAPDVVHLNTYGHGCLSFRAPKVMTAHSCVLSWWKAVRGEPAPPVWDRYRDEIGKSLRSVDRLTAPSHAMLRMLQENYGSDLPPVQVVANGCGHQVFFPPASVMSKKPTILIAGRLWDEAKNVASIACIAGSLPWPVYAAGDTSGPDGTEPQLNGCRVLGRLAPAALARWYRKSAIYLHPARYEPFGLCVLEAALSGCALVLGDLESLRELWDGVAMFVSPDDPHTLKSVLRELIATPSLRTEMSSRSTARARTFTAERMANGYLDVYRRLMTGLPAERRSVCVA